MSTDVATLVLAVDANQVSAGGKALDALTSKGKEAESQTGKLTSATNTLSRAYGAVAVALAAWKVADFIKDTSMMAARFETMGIVMKIAANNAGYTREQAEKYSVALQAQGISMMQSRDAIVQLATANIDLAKAQDLGRAAQDLAVVAGINSSEAMERMIHGIKAGEIEILRTLGMNVSWEASYKRTAAQLGITSDKLTEQQKVMSRTNEVIREGIKYQGIYEEAMGTAGKAITSLTRYWDNLKIKMGEAFLPALSEAVNDLTAALKAANAELDRLGSQGTITSIGKTLAGAFTTVKETVLVLGANVTYVFAGIGREIGAIAAQAVALSKLDFVAFGGIGEALRKDNEAASKALTAFENSVMKTGKGNATQMEESMMNARASSKKTEEQRIAEGAATRKAQEAEAALLAKKTGGKGKSGPSEADTYKQLTKEIYEKTAAMSLEDDGTRKLTASENIRAKLLYDLTNGQVKLTAAHKSTILTKLAALEIAEREKAAAIAYSKAIRELNDTVVTADDSTRVLDAAQAALLETMRQPEWENMPDSWKETVIAVTAMASAQLEVIKNQRELNDLIEQTPTVKLEKSREQMQRLAEAYLDGKLGIVGSTEAMSKYAEVVDVALGRNIETLQKEANALDEFTKSAAQSMQKSLADFLFDPFSKGTQTMLQQFGTMVKQMIAQAVAADLMNRLFGNMGKTGEVGGLIGTLFKGISGIASGGSSAAFAGSDVPIGVIPNGTFAVGTDYVPFDMIAKIHKGEKITPASENKQSNSGNSGGNVYNMTVVVPAGSPSETRRAAGVGAREVLSAFRSAQRYA